MRHYSRRALERGKQNLRKSRVIELPGRHVRHVHENSDGYGEVGGWEGALRPNVGEGVVAQSPRPPLLTPPLRGRPAAPKQVTCQDEVFLHRMFILRRARKCYY